MIAMFFTKDMTPTDQQRLTQEQTDIDVTPKFNYDQAQTEIIPPADHLNSSCYTDCCGSDRGDYSFGPFALCIIPFAWCCGDSKSIVGF